MKDESQTENQRDMTGEEDLRDERSEQEISSTDMDSENGLLRMGDNANSTMEVTKEGLQTAVDDAPKTNTATIDVTKSKKSADKTSTSSKAEKKAKKQPKKSESSTDKIQKEREEDIAETGTDLNNKPVY